MDLRERVLAGDAGRLWKVVRANPDRTAGEYRAPLGTPAAAVTAGRAVRRLGLTHKTGAARG